MSVTVSTPGQNPVELDDTQWERAVAAGRGAHISQELILSVESALAQAIQQVEEDDIAAATVTLAFSIKKDESGEVQVSWQEKHARGRKGQFTPAPFGQMRLE